MPKDPELSDAQRLFVWVLGSESDDDRVIPLPRDPRVHINGQAPGHQAFLSGTSFTRPPDQVKLAAHGK